MKYNIYEKWLKKEMIGKCRIVKAKKGGVASVGFCFKSVLSFGLRLRKLLLLAE